ncbi:ANTAR domain-containing protein [Microcella putealis]|uniref:ANTAR domain-containing protein n=1 Tax=Microcella putealis TaxID=337005 RepID=A0A4Q7LXL8_9MICO|nr:ANTAR domain-containing protein [Microcella putealis]RZS58988.1 ANTAR domain-containing protein [Microcella putealis]TQM24014.1 ANTAR domain-containing protein [Microcella putealis]
MSEFLHGSSDDVVALCDPFLIALPFTGALVSVIDGVGLRTGVAASDPVAARWDEWELELGIGPLTQASATATARFIPDLDAADARATVNPLLAEGLLALGIHAVLALPLVLGSATIGVAGLYRTTPGGLTEAQWLTALEIARAITLPTVRRAVRVADAPEEGDADARGGLRREVHQATGMLSALLDISLTDAFARLRAAAIASGRSISALAADIVERRIDGHDL